MENLDAVSEKAKSEKQKLTEELTTIKISLVSGDSALRTEVVVSSHILSESYVLPSLNVYYRSS